MRRKFSSSYSHKGRIEWVVEQCDGKDVLDVGCVGSGDPQQASWLHGTLCRVAKSILGIDFNKVQVEKLRRLGYNIVCVNAEAFMSNSQKFDTITACEVMEHLDNVGKFLDCAWKNLRNNGKLVITVPNCSNPSVWLTGADAMSHIHVFTLNHMMRTLKRHGFKVVEFTYFRDSENRKPNLRGRLFNGLIVPLFPKFAPTLGVVAEKVNPRENVKK